MSMARYSARLTWRLPGSEYSSRAYAQAGAGARRQARRELLAQRVGLRLEHDHVDTRPRLGDQFLQGTQRLAAVHVQLDVSRVQRLSRQAAQLLFQGVQVQRLRA